MTTENQVAQESNEQNNKDYNFAQLRKKTELAQREAEEAKQALRELQNRVEQMHLQKNSGNDDEEEYLEPYVDNKRLKKVLSREKEKNNQEVAQAVQMAVNRALEDERRRLWLKSNPDFQQILEEHAKTLEEKAPALAEMIINNNMDNFEKQKMAYEAIKAANLHKKPEEKPSIQDKIEANKRNYYYQPQNVSSAPYQSASTGKNWNPQEMKTEYEKVQALKQRLRLG